MKNTILKIACATALMGTAAFAQTSTSETSSTSTTTANGATTTQSTTTTTESSGTITEFSPGNTIVLKESSGPRTYQVGKSVTYVTKSGKPISADEVQTRIKVGVPVQVEYATEGDTQTVSRVVVEE